MAQGWFTKESTGEQERMSGAGQDATMEKGKPFEFKSHQNKWTLARAAVTNYSKEARAIRLGQLPAKNDKARSTLSWQWIIKEYPKSLSS